MSRVLLSMPVWRRWVATAAFFAFSAAAAQAATPISFLYTGHGSATVQACVAEPDCLEVTASGVANDWAGLVSPIAGSWEVLAAEVLLGFPAGTVSGSWVFADIGPDGNSLLGSLTGSVAAISPTLAKGEVQFTVEDGTGIFSGATGTGVATVYFDLLSGNYTEAGAFNVVVVPEPSTWALLLAGTALVGLRARRRRD